MHDAGGCADKQTNGHDSHHAERDRQPRTERAGALGRPHER